MSMNDQPPPGGTDLEVEALEALAQMETKAAVAEEVFVKNYLPIFASNDSTTPISKWLEVSGHVYREVDVIKDGAVLFTVPPLLRRSNTNSRRNPRESLYEVLDLAAKKTQQNPNIGRAFMRTFIEQRVEKEGVESDDVKRWNDIFTRYGYSPIAEVAASETTEVEKEESDALFDDGYEAL